MALPPDIARSRHTWKRKEGDSWTSADFRTPVRIFLDTFLNQHDWATSISVTEKFHEPGIHRFKPYGTSQLASEPRTVEAGFRQSKALPVLIFTAIRRGDNAEIEVAVPFPAGALTSLDSQDFYLGQARQALEAEEARRPLP